MRVEVVKVDLPLKKRFAIAKGSAVIKTNVLAILEGRYCGESSGSVAYGPSADVIEADVLNGVSVLQATQRITPEVLQTVDSLPVGPTARAAIMGMVVNCLSGESGRLPWEILNLNPPGRIRTSMTFALDDPIATVEQIISSPYPIVKIKMGDSRDFVLLELLKNVRGKEIRVDANGGWSVAQAGEMIARLARIGVYVIEQPTAPEFITEWPQLKGSNKQVELFADEEMNVLGDFQRLGPYCDGINIKMAKSGGILEAARMALAAREAGKKVMLGCMVESSVGIAQSVYMGSLADYFDLDGPLLLERDIADGITYDLDTIILGQSLIGGPVLRQHVVQNQALR